jgi:DNA-directed RNA polymerase subunit RPC12/RpoP
MLNKRLFERLVATDKYALVDSFLSTEGIMLPQRVVCHGCGQLLYEGAELKPPDEIIHQHEGKCPNCGKKLSLLPLGVEVKPIK